MPVNDWGKKKPQGDVRDGVESVLTGVGRGRGSRARTSKCGNRWKYVEGGEKGRRLIASCRSPIAKCAGHSGREWQVASGSRPRKQRDQGGFRGPTKRGETWKNVEGGEVSGKRAHRHFDSFTGLSGLGSLGLADRRRAVTGKREVPNAELRVHTVMSLAGRRAASRVRVQRIKSVWADTKRAQLTCVDLQ